jgi:3-isopropylmalate/(R)-2-methylmalate dehydratase small subunit
MKIKGRAWKFGDHIDTDVIIPARFLTTTDPQVLGRHCLEDADPGFSKKVKKGGVLVAGKNFGSGSSREHAPIAIKAAGIACVIAESFSRIFYRNAFNMGLLIFECPEAAKQIEEGDWVTADPQSGLIEDLNQKKQFKAEPIPAFMQQLIDDGGLIAHIMKKGRKGHEVRFKTNRNAGREKRPN